MDGLGQAHGFDGGAQAVKPGPELIFTCDWRAFMRE